MRNTRPDWLRTPPQITLRSNALRAKTLACLRFNMHRLHVTMAEGIQAFSDYVDAAAFLDVFGDMDVLDA